MVVASTGPATTGRPQASTVSWHSNRFRDPPPTMCTTATCRPVSSAARRRLRRYASARLSRTRRTISARVEGSGCSEAQQAVASRAGMSPGASRSGESMSTTGRKAGAWAAWSSRAVRSTADPTPDQVRQTSESTQSPITLRKKRIVPSTPASLVKFACRAASLSTGASSSRPTNDQVPDETYAASSRSSGTATTAEAVSWDPTAVTTGTWFPHGPECGGHLAQDGAQRLAGAPQGWQQPLRDAQPVHHGSGLTHGCARRAAGSWTHWSPPHRRASGQPEAEQVRDQQHRLGRL